jgi:Protein of unknown function (DUF2630)
MHTLAGRRLGDHLGRDAAGAVHTAVPFASFADAEAVLARLGADPAGWPPGPGSGIIGVTTTTEESQMDDKQLLARIGALVEEEHDLEREATADGLDEEQQARLRHLEVQLDQCWDLLRQRRARRDAGLDPEDAHVRPEGTVEGYLQ